MEDLPSAVLCSLPEEFGTQVLVVFASRMGVQQFDFDLFGVFENKERLNRGAEWSRSKLQPGDAMWWPFKRKQPATTTRFLAGTT
jgi:hypothetical protein